MKRKLEFIVLATGILSLVYINLFALRSPVHSTFGWIRMGAISARHGTSFTPLPPLQSAN